MSQRPKSVFGRESHGTSVFSTFCFSRLITIPLDICSWRQARGESLILTSLLLKALSLQMGICGFASCTNVSRMASVYFTAAYDHFVVLHEVNGADNKCHFTYESCQGWDDHKTIVKALFGSIWFTFCSILIHEMVGFVICCCFTKLRMLEEKAEREDG